VLLTVEIIYVSWMLVYTVKDHAATKLACMVMVGKHALASLISRSQISNVNLSLALTVLQAGLVLKNKAMAIMCCCA